MIFKFQTQPVHPAGTDIFQAPQTEALGGAPGLSQEPAVQTSRLVF